MCVCVWEKKEGAKQERKNWFVSAFFHRRIPKTKRKKKEITLKTTRMVSLNEKVTSTEKKIIPKPDEKSQCNTEMKTIFTYDAFLLFFFHFKFKFSAQFVFFSLSISAVFDCFFRIKEFLQVRFLEINIIIRLQRQWTWMKKKNMKRITTTQMDVCMSS